MQNNSEKIIISIVMPCLNEERTIASCIKKAKQALSPLNLKGEIIISDNGSADVSKKIAEELGTRVIEVKNKGYGAALMGGISSAQGEYIIMGDADDSYDFSSILPFIEKLEQGYDLVVGCRFPKGGGKIMPNAMPWKHRWIGNPILTAIGKLFFKSPLKDFHCGLRAFKKSAILKMDLKTTGMEFASEMIIKATLLNMKIAEVPVTLYKDGRDRPPHLRSWRDGWRHLRFMLLFSPRWLFLVPGAVLFLFGTIFVALLLYGPLWIGKIGFDTNTLLVSSMCVLVGFQLMSFALFTKIFAISQGLLPIDDRVIKFSRSIKLEAGIISGILFILIGAGLLIKGILYWEQVNFGFLSYPQSLRIVIPAVTSITLGVEVIFSSFFLSVLSLKQR